jgi:hypothetical protein
MMPRMVATLAVRTRGPSPLRVNVARARMPPSPSLSALRMKTTYLSVTMRMIDQKTSEITP